MSAKCGPSCIEYNSVTRTADIMKVIYFCEALFVISCALFPPSVSAIDEDRFPTLYRAPLDLVLSATSRGYRYVKPSPSDGLVSAALVTEYSLPAFNNSDSYNRESITRYPFQRLRHSASASVRKGAPLPQVLVPPKGSPKSSEAQKHLLPLDVKSYALNGSVTPSVKATNLAVFKGRQSNHDDSGKNDADEEDSDEFLEPRSSVFFRMGNSHTSYSIAHPSQPNSEVRFIKSATSEPLLRKSNDRPPDYSFRYEVSAPQSSYLTASSLTSFGHSENRKGSQTRGKYYVNLPDGRKQIVEYYADETGYHPVITYV